MGVMLVALLLNFRYPLADNPDEFLPVATTRPETILGDTAVAVHPEDERYKVRAAHVVPCAQLGRCW